MIDMHAAGLHYTMALPVLPATQKEIPEKCKQATNHSWSHACKQAS
jgi:hypothetical protein